MTRRGGPTAWNPAAGPGTKYKKYFPEGGRLRARAVSEIPRQTEKTPARPELGARPSTAPAQTALKQIPALRPRQGPELGARPSTAGSRARLQRDGVYGVPLDALESAFRRIEASPLIWFSLQNCEGRSRELDVRINRSSSLSPFQASEPKAPDPKKKAQIELSAYKPHTRIDRCRSQKS